MRRTLMNKWLLQRRAALGNFDLALMLKVAIGAGFIAVLACGCGSDASSKRNAKGFFNVILISIDTLRADHLACYGYYRKTSPNIDAFAEESLLFENAFSASPTTLPSHMSIFTGVTPPVHEVKCFEETFIPLSSSIKTLPEILRDHGFTTYGYRGNPYQLKGIYGFGRGFPGPADTTGTGYYGYRQSLLFSKHIYEMRRGQPFFLFLHNYDVHVSDLHTSKYLYDGPPEFRDRFTQGTFDHNVEDVWYGREELTDKEMEQVIARYDGGILHADNKIGRLFALLKKEGLYDNSLIVLTADHGESLGARGKLHGHGGLYDVGAHVPLIVKFPVNFKASIPLKGRIGSLVRTIDILPTILDALSIEPPSYIEGKSLLRLEGDRINTAIQGNDWYAVRTSDSKILFNGTGKSSGKTNVEVFDVKDDPTESKNLYETEEAKSDHLLQLADETWAKKMDLRERLKDSDRKMQSLDAETVKGLKALGYLGD